MKQGILFYNKRRDRLSESDRKYFEELLENLDHAILNKEKERSRQLAQKVSDFLETHYKKTALDHVKEIVYAIVFAVVIAFLVRVFWFELYQVPTGSMRPSIEELDRLFVSKTTFGVRIPFRKGLLFFSPERLKRNGMIVFSAKGLDVGDPKTLYFYLFPGYKQFIKRCMGKPGDTLYFYGGRIYGIDVEGNPITDLSNEKTLQEIGIEKIEHIPVITFDGKFELERPLANGIYRDATILQMNQPLGKMELMGGGNIKGFFYDGKKWIEDQPEALKSPRSTPKSYSDLWGIGNFANCRLLTKKELTTYVGDSFSDNSDALLFLELRHTPNMTFPKPEVRRDELGQVHPTPTPYTTILPLNQELLSRLQNALFTSRFTIKDGRGYHYQEGGGRPQPLQFDPLFPGVPNGTYEFYYGKGYKVNLGGILTELPSNHPLNSSNPENVQKLFNLGIAFNLLFSPFATNQPFNPQRFAYYRDGDLYVMGAPLIKKNEESLLSFVKKELSKQEKSTSSAPYIAFIDHGPPFTQDGAIDVEFIRNFGLKIPENRVLALGDNYSNSSDSRDFGFVPVENLRGAPSFTFWPPQSRFGTMPQASYPIWTLPNLIVWSLVALIILLCILYWLKRRRSPQFKRRP